MIAFLFVLGTINFADKAIIGLAAGSMIAQFHLSASQWGIIGGSFYFLFSVSSIFVAPWGDVVGSKRVLALLATLWMIIQFATVFIASFPFLLLSRILLGAGEGPSYPVSTHSAAKWLPQIHQTKGFSLITLGSAIGPAVLAPLLAFIISISWRFAFGLLGGIGLLWVVLWVLRVQEQPEQEITRKKKSPIMSFFQRDVRRIFLTRTALATILGGFAAYWYLAILVTWMPSYLIQARHLRPTDPWYLLGISLPWLVGGIIQVALGVYCDYRSRKSGSIRTCAFLLGAVLVIGAVLLMLVIFIPWTPLAVLLLACSPLGAAFPLVATLLVAIAPQEHQGTAQGIGVGMYSLAGIIAPIVTGAIIQHAGNVVSGYTTAYLVASILILLIGIVTWRMIHPNAVLSASISSDVSLDEDNHLDLVSD